MNKKKLIAISSLVALIVVVGVGSAFAWFFARDEVINRFTTGMAMDPNDPKNIHYGVKVEETWDEDEGENIVPGIEINKDVRARNKASYKSFIRIKFEPLFTDSAEGVELKDLDTKYLNLNMINLTTADILKDEEWVLGKDGYYYFLKVLDPEEETSYLLDSVKLDKNVKKQYGNASFDIIVDAESVQASNGAAAFEWKDAGQDITNKLSNIAKNAGLEK